MVSPPFSSLCLVRELDYVSHLRLSGCDSNAVPKNYFLGVSTFLKVRGILEQLLRVLLGVLF